MKDPLKNRLRRAAGQLDALMLALDSHDADCRDILIRAKTIRSALDGFATAFIEDHMEQCMREKMNTRELAENLESALKYFS